ncbi:hypothetical protein NC652_031686 [Populus alba x Populus x berolinensis]|nr:hypothetical protein NC652_031686 [Populus alba x Populus x berolinensis]
MFGSLLLGRRIYGIINADHWSKITRIQSRYLLVVHDVLGSTEDSLTGRTGSKVPTNSILLDFIHGPHNQVASC